MTDDSEYKYFHKIDEGYLSVSPFFGKIEEIDGKKIDQRTRRVSPWLTIIQVQRNLITGSTRYALLPLISVELL